MRIHHIALRTTNVAKVARFYREIFGLKMLQEPRRERGTLSSVWLDAAGTTLMIERAGAGEPRVDAAGMELLAFGLTKRKHAAFRANLARRRVRVEAETSFTSYFRDPDGRRVAVSHFKLPNAPRMLSR